MTEIFYKVFTQSLQVTFLVLLMMTIIDLLNIRTRGKITQLLKGKKGHRQYLISSFIGVIPGCFGGFTNVSLYMHGLISFGALAGSMIAVSGDEAFVMLSLFPSKAILLFGILFIIGIVSGYLIDLFVKKFRIITCVQCDELIIHEKELSAQHYLLDHIYEHIIKKHIWRVFIWTLLALLFVELGLKYLNLEKFSSEYKIFFILFAALIGIIPESGPNLIIVSLFANGLVPFSVLLTNSIVQDGHGMLPLFSYSISDSIKIKLFNFTIGLIIGLILFILGF